MFQDEKYISPRNTILRFGSSEAKMRLLIIVAIHGDEVLLILSMKTAFLMALLGVRSPCCK